MGAVGVQGAESAAPLLSVSSQTEIRLQKDRGRSPNLTPDPLWLQGLPVQHHTINFEVEGRKVSQTILRLPSQGLSLWLTFILTAERSA
jgi:hypothetical protein